MAISKLVKTGIKVLKKAEKKAKAPSKEPLKEDTDEFRKVYAKKFAEAKAKGQRKMSISNVLKKAPTGQGYVNQPKKVEYTVIRTVDPKTGKKRAKKKDLTGLTPKEKMQRTAMVSDAKKKIKGLRKDTEGTGEKSTVKLADRVMVLSPKAKGKSASQILKEGRVSPATRQYVNPNLMESVNSPLTPKMSNETRRMRRMAQLKVLPEKFFKSKSEELDVVRGNIPPSLTSSQIASQLRESVARGTQKIKTSKGVKETPAVAATELKKFPKRKTLSIGDKLKGTMATEKNIKKQILKINKGDFGGPNKSLVSNVPKQSIKKGPSKLTEKGVSYDTKTKTADVHKYRPVEVRQYRNALGKVEKNLMSNTAKATLNDLKNRSVIKNASKGSPYASIKNRVSKLIEKQNQTKPKLIGSLKMKLDNLTNRKPAAKGVKEKFGVIPRKSGGILKAKAGTKKKTVGKSKLGKLKGAMLSLMPMGVYDSIDMIDTAIRTGVPFKSGTKGKTIRGCGKAMRGYGKAMTKGSK
jgi:hypothetical protein